MTLDFAKKATILNNKLYIKTEGGMTYKFVIPMLMRKLNLSDTSEFLRDLEGMLFTSEESFEDMLLSMLVPYVAWKVTF